MCFQPFHVPKGSRLIGRLAGKGGAGMWQTWTHTCTAPWFVLHWYAVQLLAAE